MCTKKKFQKYLPKKYGCVTYLQPCVFNERALRDETSGRVFLCSFSLTCAIFRSALSIAAMQRHPILIVNRDEENNSKCLVVGNPRLPSAVAEQWGWSDIPYAAQEASLIGEIMQVGV